MKCLFLIILGIAILNLSESSYSKSKGKNKNKSKNKKDGPLYWNSMGYDGILDGLLKTERKQNSVNNNFNNISTYTGMMTHIETGTPAFISTDSKLISQNKSENQKSKTFRTVSPFEDSTKDSKGNKYSSLYKRNSLRGNLLHSGYYGSSRLTR